MKAKVMTHSSLEAAWANGGAALGGWVSNLEFSPDLYRRAEYDYVGIDCQHAVLSEAQVAATIVKVAPGGPAIVVRVSKNDPALIGKLCDAGADGIIVPMVNTAEEAAAAVAATHYPPRGVRSFGPHGRGLRGLSLTELGERVSVFAMVETSDGLKNVEEIAVVAGLARSRPGPGIECRIAPGAGPRPPGRAVRHPQLLLRSGQPAAPGLGGRAGAGGQRLDCERVAGARPAAAGIADRPRPGPGGHDRGDRPVARPAGHGH
jgi:hypothetical protein